MQQPFFTGRRQKYLYCHTCGNEFMLTVGPRAKVGMTKDERFFWQNAENCPVCRTVCSTPSDMLDIVKEGEPQ